MRHLRNVAIIMVLALGVAFVPGGGNAADTVLTALLMAFLAAAAWFVYTLSRQNSLTLLGLSDGLRAVLYAAVALIALLIAGTDRFFETGLGTLAWLVLLGAAVAAIWRVWLASSAY
jgi:hypothetical protein